ncbi:hypothetical protein BVRB_5g100710 isoform A [Beta vulgaris subsp. vulgaris]|nr:hypothetical protein BVRB_5g100710 isoform A [Beta vulgaris subsp. vulgaris]
MVSRKKSDWPPAGWTVEFKIKNGRKTKYYINTKTHQKFYSKPAVLRFIKDGCVSNKKFQPVIEHAKKKSSEKIQHLVEANNSEWLPSGWVMETRFRKSGARVGTEYKCFIDPSTGTKLFSKPEVLRYLGSEKTKQHNAESSRQKDRGGSEHSSSKKVVDRLSAQKSNLEPKVSQISKSRVRKSISSEKPKVVTERTADEELPSGWIKETRIKMLDNKVVRRDSFYSDPASRLVFCSKLEVLRYVETGEVSRHAFRRRNGSVVGEGFAIGKTAKSSSSREKTPKSWTKEQLFIGEANSGQNIQALPEAGGSEQAEGKRSTRSSCRVPALTGAQAEGKKSQRSSRGIPALTGASTPKQGTLSPKSASNSQEMVVAKNFLEKVSGTKDTVGMTKQRSAVQNADVKVTIPRKSEPSSSSSKGIFPEENPVVVTIQDCSAQYSKRKLKNSRLACVPSRSSKRLACMSKQISAVQNADIKFATLKKSEPSSSTSRGIFPEENPVAVAIQDCSNGKAQSSKRKLDSKLACGPSRSSKRLAGVDVEVVYYPVPVEHALRAMNRMSSQTNPISSLKSVPIEFQDKNKDDDTQDWNDHDLRAASRNSCRTQPIPNLKSVPKEIQDKCQDVVDTQDVIAFHEEKHRTLEVDAEIVLTTEGEPSNKIYDLICQEEKQSTLDDNTEIVLTTVEESSNKIDDVTFQEGRHHTLDVDNKIMLATHGPNIIDDLEFHKEKHCALDVDTESVLATHGELSNKIDDLSFQEEKHLTLDFDPEIVLATHGELSTKIDDGLTIRSPLLVDLNDLQLEQAPPGFFETSTVEASPITTKQPPEHLTDTLLKGKVANTSMRRPILEKQVAGIEREPSTKIDDDSTTKSFLLADLNDLQLEQAPPGFFETSPITTKQSPEYSTDTMLRGKVVNTSVGRPILEKQVASIEKKTEEPQSEFCFSSPLWSDPCLEFAFKTLTGAIPFDDNLAIQDYIQHQLRTSEERNDDQYCLSDMRAPSSFKNDEAKKVSQSREDVNFPEIKGKRKL